MRAICGPAGSRIERKEEFRIRRTYSMEATFKGGVTAELSKVYLRDSFEGVLEGSLAAFSEDQLGVYRERTTRDLDGRGHPGYFLVEPREGRILPRNHFTLLFVRDGRFVRQTPEDRRYDKLMLVMDVFIRQIDPDMSLGGLLKSVTETVDFEAYACVIDYRNDFERSCSLEEGLEDSSRYPEWL